MKKYNLYMKRRSLLMQAKGLGEGAFDMVADTAAAVGDVAKAAGEAVGIEMQETERTVDQKLKAYGADLEDQMATAKFKGTCAAPRRRIRPPTRAPSVGLARGVW